MWTLLTVHSLAGRRQLRTRSLSCPVRRLRRPEMTGTESAGDITRHRCERDGAFRTQIGPGETGVGRGLLLVTGWEESGRSHPARTALNLAQPS